MVYKEMMPEAYCTCTIHTDTAGVTVVVRHTDVNTGLKGNGIGMCYVCYESLIIAL